MSKYADKIKTNQRPSDDDWNQHLIESHKIASSMTPAAFAEYKTKDGITSYEILAKSIEGLQGPSNTVLDLACGDGYMFQFLLPMLGDQGNVIGVDMSDGELAVAKANYGRNTRVKLHQATAQSLPLPDRSIDAIVCHMAFMLMMPLDPVVFEVTAYSKAAPLFRL